MSPVSSGHRRLELFCIHTLSSGQRVVQVGGAEQVDDGQMRRAQATVVLVLGVIRHSDLIAFLLRELVFVSGATNGLQSASTNVVRVRSEEPEGLEDRTNEQWLVFR